MLALGAWAWTSVLGLVVFADELSDVPAANLALLLVAQLAISLTPLSLAFMLSRLGLREQGLNAAGNIGGMVLTFLGGAWVPLSLMGEEVRTVAHFVPTYWVLGRRDHAAGRQRPHRLRPGPRWHRHRCGHPLCRGHNRPGPGPLPRPPRLVLLAARPAVCMRF